MIKKCFAVAFGVLLVGIPTAANAQFNSTYDYLNNPTSRSLVGPFTQPFQKRCGVVGTNRDDTDMVFWSISKSAEIACRSAINQAQSNGYKFIGFYEIPSELSRRNLTMVRPRTKPSRGGICFAQPGQSCYKPRTKPSRGRVCFAQPGQSC